MMSHNLWRIVWLATTAVASGQDRPLVGPSGPLELGIHNLAATKHTIRFTVVGKDAVSENFWFGVSAIDLLAATQEP